MNSLAEAILWVTHLVAGLLLGALLIMLAVDLAMRGKKSAYVGTACLTVALILIIAAIGRLA